MDLKCFLEEPLSQRIDLATRKALKPRSQPYVGKSQSIFRDPGLFLNDIHEHAHGQACRAAPAPMGSLWQGVDANCAIRGAKGHYGFGRGG